jgi:hypothetical protein
VAAVPYTDTGDNEEPEDFMQQQQAGAGFLKVELSGDKPSQLIRVAAAERNLLEKLDLQAVALLIWRLQGKHNLPLGVLAGM